MMSFTKLRTAVMPFLLLLLLPWSFAQAVPQIQHWQTENGALVYFVPTHELPMVDVRVVFDAGAARDGGKPGLAALTNHMLTQGAAGLSADEIAQRFEGVGASSGSGSERDMAWMSLRSLRDPALLTPALETLATVLGRPDFPAEDFERERQRMLIALAQQKQSPSTIAQRAFFEAVYGDHPYANHPSGTEEGVKALTLEDLRNFYRRYYVANNATIAIVGDLDRGAAEKLAADLVDKLPAGKRPPALPPTPELKESKTVRIAYPSAQSHVMIGQTGMYRGDPLYFPLYVGNHALGGSGLVSRLNDVIREQRGMAYSVYSYFSPMRREGPFIMGMQTRTDQADEGIALMRETLEGFIQKGISKEELKAAKDNITGGFPLRIDSNSDIVEYLSMIGFYRMPLDYLETFTSKVEAVGREDVTKSFDQRLHPDRMVTVIVGTGQ